MGKRVFLLTMWVRAFCIFAEVPERCACVFLRAICLRWCRVHAIGVVLDPWRLPSALYRLCVCVAESSLPSAMDAIQVPGSCYIKHLEGTVCVNGVVGDLASLYTGRTAPEKNQRSLQCPSHPPSGRSRVEDEDDEGGGRGLIWLVR